MLENKETLLDGITFTALPDERFKTTRLTVGMFLPLREETAAAYALLPVLLIRATKNTPNMIAMHRRLSNLYGGVVTAGVQRLGDSQLLTISIQCIDNRFALQGEDIAEQAAQLLLEMLFCPHLEADGLFDEQEFEQEKRCLLERIAAHINDKRSYAHAKATELLAPHQPYSVAAVGTEETAKALTRESLTVAWKTMLQTAQMHWFYASSDNGDTVKAAIARAFATVERQPVACDTVVATATDTVREGSEEMAVAQAKLSLAFVVDAAEPQTRTVMAARLMCALFGGTANSLLFRNVREKKSLCYYCRSTYDRIKGVMMVDSGVDIANVAVAKEAILEQLQVMKDGAFTSEDLESARLRLKSEFSDKDNAQGSKVYWWLGQSNTPVQVSPDRAVEILESITAQEVVAVANTVQLQSTFAVLPEGGAQ